MKPRPFFTGPVIAAAAIGLSLICVPFIWPAEAPAQNLNSSKAYNYVVAAQPIPQWRVLFNSSTADGAITDLYGWASFSTAAVDCMTYPSPGRLLINRGDTTARVKVVGLFSTAGAAATVRLWRFDWFRKYNAISVPTTSPELSAITLDRAYSPTNDATLCLGMPYPLAASSGATGFTLTATAHVYKAQVSGSLIWPQSSGGTTLYVSPELTFDLDGGFAIMGTTDSITAGTFVLATLMQ